MRLHRLVRAIVLLAAAVLPATAADRPNIVFVLADDLRWNCAGFAGNKEVRTPNLDALATQSVRFTNAFVTTSICCVSRATLLSGQHARRHGIENFSTHFTAEAWQQTYPALLRAAGYRTGFVGKYGVGTGKTEPRAQFDYWDATAGQGNFYNKPADVGTVPHLTTRQGDSALRFIDSVPAGQPFCLSLSFKAPHAQDGAAREFWPDPQDEPLYADLSLTPGPLVNDRAFSLLPPFLQTSEARTRGLRRFVPLERWQTSTKDYYRLVTGLDRQLGRLRAKLAEKDLAARTVIIFSSDNGFYLGDRGLSDKWFMHEESLRVPLVIHDARTPPAHAAGKEIAAVALNIDVAPTILDYAGLPRPARMQGQSLRPFVEGAQPADWRTEFYYEHVFTAGGRIPVTEGVRTPRWTYTRYPSEKKDGATPEELFDRDADPLQLENLAPKNPDQLAKLRARCDELGAAAR